MFNIKNRIKNYFDGKKTKKDNEKRNEMIKKLNPYFLDFPITNLDDDYIGFESYVDGLYLNIKSKAKMIGIVADYGSGKSTVVSLLEKKLEKENYKVVKINLWDSINVGEDNSVLEVHKRFLFQLSSQLQNKISNYLSKRLNPNYSVMSISTKNKKSILLLIFAIICFAINFLNNNELLHYFNLLPKIGLEWLEPLFRTFADFSGIIALITTILLLVANEIVFSFSKNDKNRTITENDSIEIYLDLVKRYRKKKKLIIVIEDLDRISDKKVNYFLKQIYTFYSHSAGQNITFITAIKPSHYLNDVSSNYKLFDYIVDLQKIKSKDYEYILKTLINTKSNILKQKYNINTENDEIGKWMWLARGKSLDIRQLKHRYNDTILHYVTLIDRFNFKCIDIKTCIAVNYLKNEYPIFFQTLTKEKTLSNKDEASDIRKLVNLFMKDKNISKEELWKDLNIDYTNDNGDEFDEDFDNFKTDVFDLIKIKYIQDDLELYFYNYPEGNEIFNYEENILKHNYIYDEKDFENIEEIVNNVLDDEKDFILIPMNRRRELGLPIPDMIFKNNNLFESVYNHANSEEQDYIFKTMLQLNPKNSEKAINRLKNIAKLEMVNEEFLNKYIAAIIDDFRGENEDAQLINQRYELLNTFIDKKDSLTELYFDTFPLISKKELELFNDLEEIYYFVNGEIVNENDLDYIINKINEVYKEKDYEELCKLIDEIPDSLTVKIFNSLKVFEKFNDEQKESFKSKYEEKLNLTTPQNIMSFITKLNRSFEDMEEKLILNNEEKILTDEDYCKFINKTNFVSNKTLENISSDKFFYGFNKNVQDRMFNNKYFKAYVKSKIKFDNEFEIEKDKLSALKDAYVEMFEEADDTIKDYIVSSNTALEYYKEIKLYKEYGEDVLAIFGHLKQDFDMVNTILFEIDSIDILDEYIESIPSLELNIDECVQIIDKYVNKLVKISDEAHEHFKSLLPTKSLKNKINAYRTNRRERVLQET